MIAVGIAIVLVSAGSYKALAGKSPDTAAVTDPPPTTIAVLPFRNLSADGSNAYFTSGLQAEILSQLYKVRALKVIGANSVTTYAGADLPPTRQIARELRVGSVVDATVQVVGNRVRVNLRLVDGQTENPLWVERYDRTLDDAFALQSEIAQQIVATVGATLGAGERRSIDRVPTTKAQAYRLYLRGREYDARPGRERANLESAIALYQQALALDPNFALAHATMSLDHGHMYWLRYDMTESRLARQRAEAAAAVKLAPDLSESHEAMYGVYNIGPQTDVRKGIAEIQAALRTAPNDAKLWSWLARAHRRLAEWDQFEAAFHRAVELNPRDGDLLADDGGFTYERMGRYAEALRWHERAASVAGDTVGIRLQRAWIYVRWRGQLDSLRAVMNGELGRSLRRDHRVGALVGWRLVERQPDSILQILREVKPRVMQGTLAFMPTPMMAANAHVMLGDGIAARAAFDSALVMIDSAMRTVADDWPLHQARGMALAGLGRRSEALREVDRMRESFIYKKDAFLRPFVVTGIAMVLAHAGEADASLDELERLLAEPAPQLSVHDLRLQPVWDPIRAHPRFRALLAKYGG